VEKDIDVISSESKRKFYSGDFSRLPPVVRAFQNFVDSCGIELSGSRAVVIGEGDLVGKPISFYLSKKGADVETNSSYNGNEKINCDVLVLAAGVPGLVKGENISDGCNVVDFGSSVIDGKCVGDLDMSSSLDHLGCVSKSPGGMGPLVVRYLLLNFLSQ
jgi:methylenetetrahydrofolate dehydrogenase (NADP+)/methenyltetrahydrofolate cyclohydrolase